MSGEEHRQEPGHVLIRDIVRAELRRGLEDEGFRKRVREIRDEHLEDYDTRLHALEVEVGRMARDETDASGLAVLDAARSQRDEAVSKADQIRRERDGIIEDAKRQDEQLELRTRERDLARSERDALAAERDRLLDRIAILTRERDGS